MKLCSEHCKPVCDFCKNYKDDSEITNIMDENYNFVGEGLCAKKNKRVYAENSCDDDFECFTLRD